MRILLINVCIRYDSELKIIPVGLSCIATSLAKAGFKPDILDIDLNRYTDAEVIEYLGKNSYDIVGFGSIVTGYKYVKNLARRVKEKMPGALVVVGNTVASSIPELLLTKVPQVDIAVIGEGDMTIVDIVQAKINKTDLNDIPGIAFREGDKIVITPRRKAIADIKEVPFPDYSLFNIRKYLELSPVTISEPYPMPVEQLRALPVNTARGCPHNCTFCYHAFKKDKYRYYPFCMVVDFIDSLQKKWGINYVHLWDELTFFNVERTEEFCQEIEKKGIKFYWSMVPRGNTYQKKDLDLLKRCKELGALFIGGALESASPAILKAMNKNLTTGEFIEQMDTARKAGLSCTTYLVFGYPQETPETIRNTFEVCKSCEIYPSIGFLLPLPGTPMYEYTKEHGFIPDEEEFLLRVGDRQDLHVNLTKMTDDEFFSTVKEEAIKLKNYLGIPLADDNVIKTKVYRTSRRQK